MLKFDKPESVAASMRCFWFLARVGRDGEIVKSSTKARLSLCWDSSWKKIASATSSFQFFCLNPSKFINNLFIPMVLALPFSLSVPLTVIVWFRDRSTCSSPSFLLNISKLSKTCEFLLSVFSSFPVYVTSLEILAVFALFLSKRGTFSTWFSKNTHESIVPRAFGIIPAQCMSGFYSWSWVDFTPMPCVSPGELSLSSCDCHHFPHHSHPPQAFILTVCSPPASSRG